MYSDTQDKKYTTKEQNDDSTNLNNNKPVLALLTSCTACQRRKVRCDGASPACSNCTRRNDECIYRHSIRYKHVPKKHHNREMKNNHSLSTSSTDNVRKNTSNRVKNDRKSPVSGSGRIAIERLLNSLASSGDEHSRNSSEHCGSSNSDSDSDSDIHLSSHTTPEINSKNNTASYFDILVDANPHIDNSYCDNTGNSNDNNKGDENNDKNSGSNNSEQNNENNESCSFDSNNNSYHARCTSIYDMNLPTPYHAHSPMSVSTSTSFTHTSPTFSEPSPPARLEYFQSPHAELETSTVELNENKSKVGNSYSPNLSPKSYEATHFYFDHNIGYACGIKNRQSTFNNLQFENYSKNNDVYEAHVDTITLTNSNENINSDITNTNRHSSIQFILE